VFTKLIDRNTTIPSRKGQIFSTAADNQSGVEIHVLQGERPFARDSKTIGRFKLDDIPPAARGVPQIKVSFDIDASGILHVSARELGTGKEQKITITASGGLSKDEIERMRQDGELHAEEDRKQKAELEIRNEVENTLYRAEKTLGEKRNSISEPSRAAIELVINEVKDALNGNHSGTIKKAGETLNEAWRELSAELSKKASETHDKGHGFTGDRSRANPNEGGSQPGEKKDDGPIIDAEVVDEKRAA
jgi:molecular chaperone DnaK